MVLQTSTAVNRSDHLFPRTTPVRYKAAAGDRLSLRSAALAIVGVSLFCWGIVLILAFGLLHGF
jgi:hypothetical protein